MLSPCNKQQIQTFILLIIVLRPTSFPFCMYVYLCNELLLFAR